MCMKVLFGFFANYLIDYFKICMELIYYCVSGKNVYQVSQPGVLQEVLGLEIPEFPSNMVFTGFYALPQYWNPTED